MKNTRLIDTRRRRLAGALLAAPALALGLARSAQAQARRLTLVLTVPPGTASDFLARQVGERLHQRRGRTVVVESKPGGGGVIAVQYLMQHDPDGSYLLLAPSSAISLLPLFSRRPGFDPERDLVPVCDGAAAPHTITVNSAMNVASFADYIEWLKHHPGQGSIGTPSTAGLATLLVHQIRKTFGVDVQPVPYKGGSPLLADLLGQQIPASASVLPDYLVDHRAGKLRILAHAAEQRSRLAPAIPTFTELGYPHLIAVTSFGFFARSGTDMALVADYNAAINEALADPSLIDRLATLGLEPVGGAAADYRQNLLNARTRWAPLIKETGMTVDGA